MEGWRCRKKVVIAAILVIVLGLSTIQNTSMLAEHMPGNKKPRMDEAVVEANRTTQTSSFLLPKNDFRPVTRLQGKLNCTPDSHQPLQKVSGLFPRYANYSWIFNASSMDLAAPLVCDFRTDEVFFQHFAHAMQQLYGCYTYFQQNDNKNKTQKILLLPDKMKKQFNSNAFLKGYLSVMKEQLGVNIRNRRNYEAAYGAAIDSVATIFVPGGYVISNVRELNEIVSSHIMKKAGFGTFDTTSDQCDWPRIGILNRRPSMGRSIQNVQPLVENLSNLSLHQHVLVEYFEGKSFAEQVHFFQTIDILVSPHGAQLTGLPFLGNYSRCAQLLELFPANYILPNFYGSLARNSDIGYSYHYLSEHEEPTVTEAAAIDADLGLRVRARASNLCPSPNIIQLSITELVDDWKKCCSSGRSPE